MPSPDDNPIRLTPARRRERWLFFVFAGVILFAFVTAVRLFLTGGFREPVTPQFGRAAVSYWWQNKALPQSKGIYGPDALWEVVRFVNPGRESVMHSLLFARSEMPLWPLKPKKGTEFWQTWDIEIPASIWTNQTDVGSYPNEYGIRTIYSAGREAETLVWAWRRGWDTNPRSYESVVPMGGVWVANLTPEQLTAALKHTREVIERNKKEGPAAAAVQSSTK